MLRLQNAKLSKLKHLLRLLTNNIVTVLLSNLDIFSCAVDRNACSSLVLLKVEQYQLS